tara:strand:+ start:309 stop:629 length:321 start_codon:yes stop_codon:yes gene_type:complete
MSYKVIVWKANGDIERHPFESGASISQILNILKADELAVGRARDNRLTDVFEFNIYYDKTAKMKGQPLNHKATYCVNEYTNSIKHSKVSKDVIHGDVAFEIKESQS